MPIIAAWKTNHTNNLEVLILILYLTVTVDIMTDGAKVYTFP